MRRTKRDGYMDCPLCPVTLQPLSPASGWLDTARAHCEASGVDVPLHGPAALTWLALAAHHKALHDKVTLASYLEAYLDQ